MNDSGGVMVKCPMCLGAKSCLRYDHKVKWSRRKMRVCDRCDGTGTIPPMLSYDQLAARLAASEAEREAAEAECGSMRYKLAKLAGYARHWTNCDKMKQMPTEPNRVYYLPDDWNKWKAQQPCTCGLAALQSSEKGL